MARERMKISILICQRSSADILLAALYHTEINISDNRNNLSLPLVDVELRPDFRTVTMLGHLFLLAEGGIF